MARASTPCSTRSTPPRRQWRPKQRYAHEFPEGEPHPYPAPSSQPPSCATSLTPSNVTSTETVACRRASRRNPPEPQGRGASEGGRQRLLPQDQTVNQVVRSMQGSHNPTGTEVPSTRVVASYHEDNH